ncbi:MAG: antibiotic ABC transporter permease, partial [Gammaproteobacteria bacterium]|nr:antibiotic ABC transporter permease [Gammaproteobacteria bacterium]
MARFEGSGTFEYVGALRAEGEIADVIDDKRAMMVLRIGADFGRRLATGEQADVQAVIDGR